MIVAHRRRPTTTGAALYGRCCLYLITLDIFLMINNSASPINYQLFILPYEAYQICVNFQVQFDVLMYVLIENEGKFSIVSPNLFSHEDIDKGKYTILLSSEIIKFDIVGKNELFDTCPNSLYFQVGAFLDGELSESWLYTLKISTNPLIIEIWKKIERNVRKLMLRGGYSVFVPNKSKKLVRHLSYTPNVYEKYKQGIICKPDIGKNIVFELGL